MARPEPRPYPYAHQPRSDPNFRPPAVDEGGGRNHGMIYVLMLVVVAAFGGVVWNLYAGHAPPRILPPPGAYRVAPSPEAATAPEPDDNAMYDSLDGSSQATTATPRPAAEAPLANANALAPATPAVAGRPQVAPAPSFTANGPYVAQVAALQSQAAVDAAWQRLASRAPQLFSPARLDVERADLGQRGTYFRVRAGYFADRANASRFCDRVKQMGQDCIVVAR